VDSMTCSVLPKMDILRFLSGLYEWCPPNECIYSSAARNGHFDIIQWAHDQGLLFDYYLCYFAAKNKHYDILKWALRMVAGAIQIRARTCCKWISRHVKVGPRRRLSMDESTCSEAASRAFGYPDLGTDEWLSVDRMTTYKAAEKGHLDILIWARSNGCPWNSGTSAVAARSGHLGILQWVRLNGCPWILKRLSMQPQMDMQKY